MYDLSLAWHITQSSIHWASNTTQMEYAANTFIPHVRRAVKRLGLRDSQKALCIFDVSRAQKGEVINDDLKKKDFIYCVALSCTDRQQPMDLNVQAVVDRVACTSS